MYLHHRIIFHNYKRLGHLAFEKGLTLCRVKQNNESNSVKINENGKKIENDKQRILWNNPTRRRIVSAKLAKQMVSSSVSISATTEICSVLFVGKEKK